MNTKQRRYAMAGGVVVAVALIIAAGVVLLSEQSVPDSATPRIDTAGTSRPVSPNDGRAAAVVDEAAPDFRLPGLDGDSLSMADLEGQVVVVNFWATWCAPCRVEIPDLIEMQEEFGDEGVRFVGIALEADNVEAVRAFAESFDFNYPIVIDDGAAADAFGGIYALPTTILIDRDGVIVRKISGLVTSSFLTPLLQELAAT